MGFSYFFAKVENEKNNDEVFFYILICFFYILICFFLYNDHVIIEFDFFFSS